MPIQPRYDPVRKIYRDCKWCSGKGCLSCEGEADKEYKRQFPDGPVPIATFKTDDPKQMESMGRVLHAKGITEAFQEGGGGMGRILELIKKERDDGNII